MERIFSVFGTERLPDPPAFGKCIPIKAAPHTALEEKPRQNFRHILLCVLRRAPIVTPAPPHIGVEHPMCHTGPQPFIARLRLIEHFEIAVDDFAILKIDPAGTCAVIQAGQLKIRDLDARVLKRILAANIHKPCTIGLREILRIDIRQLRLQYAQGSAFHEIQLHPSSSPSSPKSFRIACSEASALATGNSITSCALSKDVRFLSRNVSSKSLPRLR